MMVARPLSRQRGRMTKPPKRTRGLRGACLVRSSANMAIMFLSLTTPCQTLHGFASSTVTIGTSLHLFIFPKSPFNPSANSRCERMRNFFIVRFEFGVKLSTNWFRQNHKDLIYETEKTWNTGINRVGDRLGLHGNVGILWHTRRPGIHRPHPSGARSRRQLPRHCRRVWVRDQRRTCGQGNQEPPRSSDAGHQVWECPWLTRTIYWRKWPARICPQML